MEDIKICPDCKRKCKASDTSCRACSYRFPSMTLPSPLFDGVTEEEVCTYIGKNSDYYIRKFEKARDKKFFMQINWCSLLFGGHWFLYRKMYSVILIFSVISIMLSLLLNILVPTIYKDELKKYIVYKQEYRDYENSGVESLIWNEEGYLVKNEEYDNSYWERVDDQKEKIAVAYFLVNVPPFALNILFRLTGNYFYRNHVSINAPKRRSGGTSFTAVVIGFFAVMFLQILSSIIAFQFPAVDLYYEAFNSLSWYDLF